MAFAHSIQLRLNRLGDIHDNGRRLSQLLRERVLDLHHEGMSPQLIANEVRNVLRDYNRNNSSMPKMRETQPRSKPGGDVVEYLENEKLCKPSITSAELQQRLLLDGIVHPVDLPSKSAISKCMREDLVMTKEKIQRVPLVPTADALDRSDLIVASLRGLVISSLSMRHVIVGWSV